MTTSIVSTVVFVIFILLIHRGNYPARLSSHEKPVREYVEAAILISCLLLIPFIKFDLFWFTGWLGTYLIFGILSPLIMEFIMRRRGLSSIGFRKPINRKAIASVAGIAGLYILSKIVVPLIIGAEFTFTWKRFVSNSIIFAFLEEVIFRGQIQTRLESALGAVWSWVLTGLFFGFYHYYQHYLIAGNTLSIENALQLVHLAAFGMLLGVIFSKTKSLFSSYLVHALNNLPLFAM